MALTAALVAGAAFGVKHALEPDHVAAVATLLDGEQRTPTAVGASWGVGHTAPIAALGLAFVVLGVQLPDPALAAFEALVGVVLVALGVRMLAVAAGDNRGLRRHDHGSGEHSHLGVGPLEVGVDHSHAARGSLAVGALHGFAGSGALAVALVAAAPSVASALAYLAGFGALSVVTMAAVSGLWGRALAAGGRATRALQAAAGVVGLLVGATLLAEVAGVGVLL
jgi:hypothetical protein